MHILFGNGNVVGGRLGLQDATHAKLKTAEVPSAHVAITHFVVPDTDSITEKVLPTVTADYDPGFFNPNSGSGQWLGSANASPSVLSTPLQSVYLPRLWLPTKVSISGNPTTTVVGEPAPVSETGATGATVSGLHDTLAVAALGNPGAVASGLHDTLPTAALGNPASTASLNG